MDAYRIISHMGDHLIQTRVPAAVARWLAKRAAAEGDSVAGWLRRYLMQTVTKARVRAWHRHKDYCDPAVLLLNHGDCDFYLDLLREFPNGDTTFAMVHGERDEDAEGHVVTAEDRLEHDSFRRPDEYRFVLDGSPTPWVMVKQWHNLAAERLEVTLHPDHNYHRPASS